MFISLAPYMGPDTLHLASLSNDSMQIYSQDLERFINLTLAVTSFLSSTEKATLKFF